LSTGNTHREPYVGGLEGRTIVCAITSDTDDLTELAQSLNENLLILRGRSSQDLKTGDNPHTFGVVESAEDRTLHDDTSSGVDTTLCGDRAGGKDVVSGTHLDGNTSAVAGGDGLMDTIAEGIFDTSDGHQSHIAREALVIDLVGRLEAGIGRGPRLKVPVAERDGPQRLVGIENDRPRDVVVVGVVGNLGLDLGVGMLAVVRILGNDNVAGASLGEDFRGALEEQTVAAGLEANDDAHGFSLTREGDHLDDPGRLASFLPVLPLEILGELEQGGLGLGSNKHELLCLRVGILEGGGVDRDRLVDQALELGGKDRVDVTLFDREVVCVFPVDLRLVGVGYILFLDRFLLLIRNVRADLVLPEVTNKLGVDADRAGNDAHDVLGERPCLVGADDGCVGRGLAGAKDSNEEIFGSHTLRGECESEGYCERETFRDSDDDQRDRDGQNLSEGNALLTRSTAKPN
jgi:hypothetical protein